MNRLSDIYYTTESYLFSNGGRRNWRNNWKNEGIFADIGSCPPVQVPDERIALVWLGMPDERSGKDFSCVSGKISLRFSDHEVAD